MPSVMTASANGTLMALQDKTREQRLMEDFPKITLRPLIPEDKLPETVGPDSPYRHHPKYQKKHGDADLLDRAFTSFALDSKKDSSPSSSSPSASAQSSTSVALSKMPSDPNQLKELFSQFMDDVISRELVASN